MNLTIKEIVKDNFCHFQKYRKGILYYRVMIYSNGEIYEFPVPIEDCGDADFPNTDKAILFMRYIRKAIDDGTFVKI
jgi:hypothetical protein